MRNFRTAIRNFALVDYTNLSILSIIFIFYLFSFGRSPHKITVPIILLGLYLFIFVLSWFRSKIKPSKLKNLIYLLYPVVFMFCLFETFFMILPYFNELRYDEILTNIDFNMFGVNPTVWIETWINPILTDFFYLLYSFYFPLPLFIIIWLLRKSMFKELEEAILMFLFTYYGAYIIYFFIPAEGPRFFLAELQNIPLDGWIISQPIRNLINFMEPNKLDAFPSLHAAITFTAVIVCFIHNKKQFYIFFPIFLGIFVSLIYCRYHYVIDGLAGIIWSVAACFFARKVYSKFNKNFYSSFG